MTDDTILAYLSVIRAALDAIETGVRHHHWPAPVSLVELDTILSAICDQMIYAQRQGPEFGPKLYAAWAHVSQPDVRATLVFSFVHWLESDAASEQRVRLVRGALGSDWADLALFFFNAGSRGRNVVVRTGGRFFSWAGPRKSSQLPQKTGVF